MKRWIHAATYNGFDESAFDGDQMWEIERGLESGVDISQYADPKFDGRFGGQMQQIRFGLESGVDVSQYADPKFDGRQMEQIRKGLESGVDISQYADPKYIWTQMEEIRLGLEDGVDVSQYADPKFDWAQMEEIRHDLGSGVDVSQYADSKADRGQSNWIDRESIEDNEEFDVTGEDMEDLWDRYLSGPEDEVNKELEIFPEPSGQAGMGSVFIHDESGQDRWDSSDKTIDWYDWCDTELEFAIDSKNAEEYKQKYKAWMKEFLGI